MADQAALFDDVEAWTARRLAQLLNTRTDLPGPVVASNEWPTATDTAPWYIVVRYDPGARDGLGREADAGLGVTVLGDPATDIAGLETTRVAQIVAMYLGMLPATITADPGNPYADIADVSGPARVDDDSGRPIRYITANIVLVGVPTAI